MADYHIIKKPIEGIKPYGRNPRINDRAVDAVAESIFSFGFKQPIVIDKNNVIIAGHTRYLASKKLGLEEVPVIVADDLSKDQVKAYRLADNRVGELAEWDESKLLQELKDIESFDMSLFGFEETIELLSQSSEEMPSQDGASVGIGGREAPEKEDVPDPEPNSEREEVKSVSYYGDERERTFNAYNLYLFNENMCTGQYQMPTITVENHICDSFIGFNYALSSDQYSSGIHFFLDDYQFERLWASPEKYIEPLSKFDCCMTPDFSLYLEMPTAMKIWNTYRSRLIGQYMQDQGIVTIPTISWAEKASYEYCFDGIDPGGTIAVSTIGVKRDKKAKKLWEDGMAECLRRLKPTTVLVYGGLIDFDFKGITVIEIKNSVTERWRE